MALTASQWRRIMAREQERVEHEHQPPVTVVSSHAGTNLVRQVTPAEPMPRLFTVREANAWLREH